MFSRNRKYLVFKGLDIEIDIRKFFNNIQSDIPLYDNRRSALKGFNILTCENPNSRHMTYDQIVTEEFGCQNLPVCLGPSLILL